MLRKQNTKIDNLLNLLMLSGLGITDAKTNCPHWLAG